MFSAIKMAVQMIYTPLAMMIPAMRHIPLDAVLAVVDGVERGKKYNLEVDWRIGNYDQLAKMVDAWGDAAVEPTKENVRKAAYIALDYVTNIDKYESLEQFMAA